jgi:hypothetical protein
VREAAKAIISSLEGAKPDSEFQRRVRLFFQAYGNRKLAEASLRLRDYATAEPAARKAVEYRRQRGEEGRYEQGETQEHVVLHAGALARLGRRAEARAVLAPALAFYQRLGLRPEEPYLNFWLANARLVQAAATPEESPRWLAEAAAHMDRLPPAMAQLRSMTRLREDIARERNAGT